MNPQIYPAAAFRFYACLVLSCAMANLPASALAQTNAAAQAVRQRVEGLDRGGGGGAESTPAPTTREIAPSSTAPPADSSASKIDLTYVPSDAVAIIVLHPAQLMASSLAQQFPVEVASAYALKYTGFDPADVDEIAAFYQMPGETQRYGLAAKFNKPFKGSAIPAAVRGAAKLGDLGGRRYLQSPDPTGHSFYGPDSKTLIVAPDATLRQLVETKDQPKSGPLADRVLAAPADSDLYVAVDVASLRPMMQMVQLYAQQAPPEAQQFFEAPNLITAAEFTVHLSDPSPMTLVVHANDDASAEKLESLVQTGIQMVQEMHKAQAAEKAPDDDPIAAAWVRYSERTSGQCVPQRESSKLTFFRTDGADAHERQLVMAATLGFLVGKLSSATEGVQPAAGEFPGGFPTEEGMPHAGDQPAEQPVSRDSDR